MKKNTPVMVSVLTTTFNHEPYIAQALESFINQKTSFRIEVLVGDDLSSDKTKDIITSYVKKYPSIIKLVPRMKNLGVVGNMMDLFDRATGKYIALCEGDDFWTDPLKLQKQVDFLESNPEVTVCFHPVKVFYQDASKEDYVFPDLKLPSAELDIETLLQRNVIQTNSVVYRRQQSYEKLTNSILPLDWYLHLLHAANGKIGYINEVMSAYRRHAGGIWWSSGEDIDAVWNRYSLEHFAMYVALERIFAGRPKEQEILAGHIGEAFMAIAKSDAKFNAANLERIVTQYPSHVSRFVAHDVLHHKRALKDLKEHADAQQAVIAHLENELRMLKEQNEYLQKEVSKDLPLIVKERVLRRLKK